MVPEGLRLSNALLACVKGDGGVSPNEYCADVSSVSLKTSSNRFVGGVLVVSSRTDSTVSQIVDCGCQIITYQEYLADLPPHLLHAPNQAHLHR